MKSAACLTLLVIVAAVEGDPVHLRPIAEAPHDSYESDDVPYTSIYKPRSAYIPFPGSAPENTHYKGYESDAMEYNRWKRSDASDSFDEKPENWMSENIDVDDDHEATDEKISYFPNQLKN